MPAVYIIGVTSGSPDEAFAVIFKSKSVVCFVFDNVDGNAVYTLCVPSPALLADVAVAVIVSIVFTTVVQT